MLHLLSFQVGADGQELLPHTLVLLSGTAESGQLVPCATWHPCSLQEAPGTHGPARRRAGVVPLPPFPRLLDKHPLTSEVQPGFRSMSGSSVPPTFEQS